ncbi:MAG: hypothetical protein UW68_C0015G0005 [Candidatus Collierbacteria bacterium GW2011_GWB1_44_6]|uniref:Uncharacterized protein n=2 Tax=Candidatus Collieribacteriota TaxID=1752725 RepID=A0A0G1LWI0_9BACT|nr:MAG: hypothetical protein UV68_C0048G0004 [Candidatus Collierbacteria bacterium GW2011_GWC2_43_12]KKT73177.1 MAG: hypothetical protein UW68_C0015G0005 [Candidatus Collierbacteria bacterium GW2011_GWB1_44_6]
MKPRKTLSIYVLLVGVMGLSIVGGILAFQVFSASVKSQLTVAQTEVVKPIDGVISQEVMQNLQQRSVITESDFISVSVPVPTQSLGPVQTATVATATASPTIETIPIQ